MEILDRFKNASGNPVAVATGNAGQVLTSASAGAPPTFSDPAPGGARLVKHFLWDKYNGS